jgi:hypothetical protein
MYEMISPSGIPIAFRDSNTDFYDISVCTDDKNSSITLNAKAFFSSPLIMGYSISNMKFKISYLI